MLATSTFIITAFGKMKADNVKLEVGPEYLYPAEVQLSIESEWEKLLRKKAEELQGKGIKTEIRDAEPLPELYTFREGDWVKIMFAGPQLKLRDIVPKEGELIIVGAKTNYAARQVTSIDAYSLLRKYGLRGIAFSLAQSLVVLLPSKEGIVSPFLHRLPTVGEYPDYIGNSAAGTLNRFDEYGCKHHILREAYEETGIVPTDDPNELKRLGIIRPEAEVKEGNYEGYKVLIIKQKGKERKVFVDKGLLATLTLLGTVTDIYVGEPGKEYVKPENAWLAECGIPSDIYVSSEVWRGERVEHDDVSVVLWDSVYEWLLENYPHYGRKGVMGCTAGVTTLAIAYTKASEKGIGKELEELIKGINEKYPITSHHPLLRMIEKNEIPKPNKLLVTTIKF